MIAWTMPNSKRGMGSIRLRVAPKDLTREAMMGALATRIERLIRKEDPERAAEILRQYEQEEGFDLELGTAAMVLAENSDRLWEAVGPQDWPVTATEHDPETETALDAETLEEFLAKLYPTERD
jgi:hypothetical protein